MAGNDEVTSFIGTIKEVKYFLDRQPTQINKHWVTTDFTGTKIYLNKLLKK